MSKAKSDTITTNLGVEVVFMDVPPISMGSSSTKWRGALEEVKSRGPGTSARIGTGLSRGIGSYLSTKYGNEFNIQIRSDGQGRADVYATYIGE